MSNPRKHHYLPQFYLEGFKELPQKGKYPHICQIEKKENQKHYNPAIKKTGCIRDYHTLDHDDQDPDFKTIETALSNIEGRQSTLVQEIINSREIKENQINEVSEFISLMRYRVPSFANHVEKSLKKIVLDSFKLMYQSGNFGVPPDSIKNMFESKGIDESLKIKISNWKIVGKILEMGLSTESVFQLSQLNYQIFYTDEKNSFVTSDNPVALYHPNYQEIKPYGSSIAFKGVELTIPLSSNVLLMAGFHLNSGSYFANKEQVAEFNRRTIIMGENYVFTKEFNSKLGYEINNLNGDFAGFKFDDLFYGDGSIHISSFIPVQ